MRNIVNDKSSEVQLNTNTITKMERRKSLKVGAALLSGLMLAPGVKGNTLAPPAESESFWNVIKGRRSVRKFKPDPIPEEHLMKIMDQPVWLQHREINNPGSLSLYKVRSRLKN